MKSTKICLSFVCGVILATLTSCLGSDNQDDYFISSAEILTFAVHHDAIKALDSVIFRIDQVQGLIYNKDSVRYGVNPLDYKYIVNYTAGGFGFFSLSIDNTGNPTDSVWINSGDTLDFSKPLHLKSYAGDGIKFKMYTVELNFATIDPDSIQYKQLASGLAFLNAAESNTVEFNGKFCCYSRSSSSIELHTSVDGKSWDMESLDGFPDNAALANIAALNGKLYLISQDGKMFSSSDGQHWEEIPVNYPVVTLIGAIQPGAVQQGVLACVIRKEDVLYFATTSGNGKFEPTDEDGQFEPTNLVPSDFPAHGFASLSFDRMQTQYLLVAGGQTASGDIHNLVWTTENGTYWAMISEANGRGRLPAMTGANVIKYGADGNLFLFNGKLSSGSFNGEVFRSKDGGIFWDKMPDKYKFPATYLQRYDASVVLGAKNIFYFFGGKNVEPVTDCWSGRQNRLIVD